MTIQQMTYDLRLVIRRLNLYDDDRLDDRLLKFWINSQRELWLRNQMSKQMTLDPQVVQSLGALQLEAADRSVSSSFATGYTILQTVLDIPKTIELFNSDGIIEVSPIDKIAIPFSYIPFERARFAGSGKYNKKIIYAFRYGNKILLLGTSIKSYFKYLRYITVRGVFSDPEAVSNFTHIDGSACYSDTDDYPINSWMWNYMREEIKKANFRDLILNPTDTENDSAETLTTTNEPR